MIVSDGVWAGSSAFAAAPAAPVAPVAPVAPASASEATPLSSPPRRHNRFSTDHGESSPHVSGCCLNVFVNVWPQELSQIADAIAELARRDVAGLGHDDLLAAHEEVTRLGRFASALQARFSSEIARRSSADLPGGGLARQQGFGSAGALIAKATGTTQAQARRSIEAGQAIAPRVPEAAPPYPAIADAVLAGVMSVDIAGIIASGLDSITDSMPSRELHDLEARLVNRAQRMGVNEVRRMVARAIARADVARLEERQQRQYEERYLTWSEDHTGMVTLSARLDTVTAAPLRTAIEQIVTHDFRARREQDPQEADQRTVGQMRADALFSICRHAIGCAGTEQAGIRTALVVRIDRKDLEAGGGVGEIDGVSQPISVGQLRRIAGDAGVIPAVLGGPSEILDLGRTVRLFSRAQRLAMLERDGGCAKCHAPPEHCEAHHIEWWDSGGRSDLGNGVMLCTRCHHDVHRQGWGINATPSRVEFVPPRSIDPERRPRIGGVAALDVELSADRAA